MKLTIEIEVFGADEASAIQEAHVMIENVRRITMGTHDLLLSKDYKNALRPGAIRDWKIEARA